MRAMFVRIAVDVLLAEYDCLRREIEIIKGQMERTYTYLFTLVAALIASQLIAPENMRSLESHPSLFLLAAILTLWFPVQNSSLNADMVCTFTYQM